jgi:hypothetical protein
MEYFDFGIMFLIYEVNGENQIELGSGGCPDIEEYNWPIGTLTNGWNLFQKSLVMLV